MTNVPRKEIVIKSQDILVIYSKNLSDSNSINIIMAVCIQGNLMTRLSVHIKRQREAESGKSFISASDNSTI